MTIRQPIVSMLGHVDTGKTLLLDRIRKTSVQAREAGGITQHIGASFFPVDTLKQMVSPLISLVKKIEIPGLLVIDTPGHEVFTNLRRRGGSVADIAILVIDVLRGFETQTYECIEILKIRKTPFIVASNKIDRVSGWKPHPNRSFLETLALQDPYVKQELETKIYEIVGTFSRLSLKADRFDQIKDFTKTIAIVPTSAKTGEGITELIMVLIGLTQQYLKKRLKTTDGAAKGTILEVKEEAGLGTTINTVIYDGVLNKDDLIVIGGKEKPIITQIRAILLPKPLDEIRDPRNKFSSVDSVYAAAGVKIAASNLDGALAGAPLYAIPHGEKATKYVRQVSKEIERIRIVTNIDGIVLKADTLGSLEAIADSLTRNGIQIRLADVGDVSKRDVIEAAIVKEHDPFHGTILAFNVKILQDAKEEAQNSAVKIFQEKIIYHLIENYLSWLKTQEEAKLDKTFEKTVKPGKIRIMEGFIFRKAKPAIVGVEILAGKITPKSKLIRAADGEEAGVIQQIQERGKALSEATQDMQVAISLDTPTVDKHIFEKDVLFVKIPESDAKILLTTFFDRLTEEEQGALGEYVNIIRKKTPFWAGLNALEPKEETKQD